MVVGTREGVEFLDLVVDASATGAPLDEPDPPRRPRWRAVVLAVLVIGGLFTAARLAGAPPPTPPADASEAPVFGGEVALPADFGAPVQFAVASGTTDDVVWALGSGGQVARVVDGVVRTISVQRGYRAVAARPDGRGVFVTTGRFAPTVVALDPVTLEQRGQVAATAPVTALAVGVGSVWAASSAGVQGWTTDLTRELRTMRVPDDVTVIRTLTIVGARLQAVVTTTPGTAALLRLEPPGGGPRLSSAFRDPVSVVPGNPALVAHVGLRGAVEIVVDPSDPSVGNLSRPFPVNASVWPVPVAGAGSWAVSIPTSATFDCFDGSGQLVGRMTVGSTGVGVRGPMVTTSRATYAAMVDGTLARGGHGSCG